MSRIIVLLALAGFILPAQTVTSRIRGIVTDPSGAIVPSAEVTVTHEGTGLTRTMPTNSSGLYAFNAMPLGKYRITVSMQGFKKFTSSANELQVGEPMTIDIQLETGAITEQITVSAHSVQVQTAEASLGVVLDTKPIENLPLNGRNPLHLMALLPGVAGHASQATSSTGTVTFSVNGDRGRGIFTTLDGVDITDPVIPRGELSQVLMNPDSISEYRVITSVAKAEYGRNSGAQVQVVTRSGTNEFHGNLFEYHRNTIFNANEWFNNRSGIHREILIRNQFGAGLGGPIRKDKTFFFFNWQSQRMAQSLTQTRTVLTPTMRNGIFRYMVGAANAPRFVDASGQPLVAACGGAVTTNCYRTINLAQADPLKRGLDRLMQSQINLTNLPNDFSGGDGFNTGIFRFNAPAAAPVNTYTTKVDHRLTDGHSAFFRWSQGSSILNGDYINSGLPRYPANPDSFPGRTRESRNIGFSAGFTSTLGNSKVNEFNLGYTRNSILFLDPTHPKFEIISNIQSDPFLFWGGTGRTPKNWQALDNFSFVKGNNTFKTGVNIRFYAIDQFRRATNFYPRLSFGTANAPVFFDPSVSTAGINSVDLTRANSLFNDLMGVVGTVQKTFYSDGKRFPSADQELKFLQRAREYNFYFQDDWRVTRQLTLNLGVRYEFNGVPYDLSGMQVVNDKPLNSPSADVALIPAGPGTGRKWYNPDKNNFAPSVGFAWSPNRDNQTAVRGGYRIAYNRLVNWALNVVEQNQPGTTRPEILRPNSGATAANPASLRASDAGVQTLVSNLSRNVVGTEVLRVVQPDRNSTPLLFDPNLTTPFVHQWNFSIQRQILPDTVLEVAYVGNKGTHMFRMLNVNQARVTPEFLASFQAAKNGVRTGPVGALLNTYGASLPSTITTNLNNNDVGGFITAVDVGVFNGVAGGRLVAAGLGQSYFRNPQFSIAALGCACTDNSYNSLQISLNRRFSQGLMVTSNYTWAKSLDDISDDTDGAGQGLLVPHDSNNRLLDRGRSNYDIRHQFRAGIIYELPFGKNKAWLRNGLLSWVAGGWTTNTIIDWSSGYPFTVSYGFSTTFPNTTSRSVFTGDPTSIGTLVKGGTAVSYLSESEKALFTAPVVGQYGAGRNIFTGPGFFQTDFALHKAFSITETMKIELRGEAFNVFNNVNFNNPNVTSTAAAFGVISSTRVPPRILQIAARFSF
ncbi:MAG: carboxypeptidase regulatory-like domain-containing protein [Acidimicrobiia bacterium]|nr:carboxypeptidase regulatory-like domain-containing protein [Acidimicrobiia bacterium]